MVIYSNSEAVNEILLCNKIYTVGRIQDNMILHIRFVALYANVPWGLVEPRRRNPLQYFIIHIYYIIHYISL